MDHGRPCPDGGGGEIRTRGGAAATRLFESRTLNRSDTPPGEHFNPHPDPPPQGGREMGSINYGLAPIAVPGDLGPVPAAAHAAPFPLARPRGVLEHPPALRVLTDAQSRRIALDQLTRDRLGKPRDGAINRVALVAMVEGDAV